MITRVLPTQVSTLWSLVKAGVLDVGAKRYPGNWELANNIFHRCLAGVVQLWLTTEEGEPPVFKGFALTEIECDNLDGGRSLAILSLYFFKQPSDALLQEGIGRLREFASSNRCKQITLIVPSGHREDLVLKAWGGGDKQTLFAFPVEV